MKTEKGRSPLGGVLREPIPLFDAVRELVPQLVSRPTFSITSQAISEVTVTLAVGVEESVATLWRSTRRHFLNTPFDRLQQGEVVRIIEGAGAEGPFRYVVTPNADHVVRLNREPWLRPVYEGAWLTVCDSKPIFLFARALARPLTHVTGADLTVELFRSVIQKGDRIALVVADEKLGCDLKAAFPDIDFRTHVPPMGLLTDPKAQQACIDFAIDAKARMLFLAVGAPQSELIAYRLSKAPAAQGTGLCVGAALEFLVGAKPRATKWLQRLGLEWLHRMASDPRRLWRRYVFGAPPLLVLFAREAIGIRATDAREASADSCDGNEMAMCEPDRSAQHVPGTKR